MSELSDLERAESDLWDAVRALYGPIGGSKAQAAARAVEALASYRAAVETRATMRVQQERHHPLAVAV